MMNIVDFKFNNYEEEKLWKILYSITKESKSSHNGQIII
jgi:hypothetical protein